MTAATSLVATPDSGLDEYARSLRDWVRQTGRRREPSPEFKWRDLASVNQQYAHTNLSLSPSSSKHVASSKKNYKQSVVSK